jgi:tRNA threonylcarbamoyladenosine biosynthesis protein TsaE
MEITTNSTQATKKLAEQIAKKLNPGDVVALYGDLGSGKTTFTNFLVKALGVSARVQSPTFVIARKYEDSESKISVNHLDLYRITSPEELEDLGFTELFQEEDSITIIEWPELIESHLPKKTLKIKFEDTGETSRKIYVQD